MNTESKKAPNVAWSEEKPDGSLMALHGPWLLGEGEEINDKVMREVSTNQDLLYFGHSCDDPTYFFF